MEGVKIIAFALILWGFQLYTVQCRTCELEQHFSGKIFSNSSFSGIEKCWIIPAPPGHFIYIKFNSIESNRECLGDYVTIKVAETGKFYKICSRDEKKNPITAFGNVTVNHFVPWIDTISNVVIEYFVKPNECIGSFQCDDKSCVPAEKLCNGVKDCKNGEDEIGCEINECIGNFQCDDKSCVPAEKLCNGVKDCKNGEDEIGCETGDQRTSREISEAREKAVSWLKQKRTPAWGWRENTPRAVVSLYLASAATFNGTIPEEELMAKQNELKIAIALLRPSLTNSELSMFINALLATCHSPRQFYGNNLVKRLKDQVEESGNFTHPLAYLALCNANESWPLRATSDLNSILNSTSEYPFVKDLQAMAVMALSCESNRSRNHVLSGTTLTLYKNTINNFKKLEAPDGSFGNVYTTALITQAFLASGQNLTLAWNLEATINYLMKELNSSAVDFLTTYFVLPILNGKSLMDISKVNCSANPRKHGDEPTSEINDYVGPKIRVKYSLYIGDERDVVHTISLRVPENYTASEVMEIAAVEDPKYKFEWKRMSGKMYVYKILNVTNDPEAGKFWLLYVDSADSSEPITHITKGPDEAILSDGEHLVLWYKTATI